MTEPKPTGAWAVWHPEEEWGTFVPHLYGSKEIAVKHLKDGGVWPLRDGWRLIRVLVTAPSFSATESKSNG